MTHRHPVPAPDAGLAGVPLHGGDLTAAARRWGLPPGGFLDFSANINPLGPPLGALAAAQQALLTGAAHYPEPFAATLRAALARRHDLPPEAVLVGNGAAELIHLLLRQAAGARVALPRPGFAEYGRAAQAVGATLVEYDFDQPPPDADWLLLCNPHNPTGHLLPPDQLLALAAATRATLLVDEAFIDLTAAGEDGSVIRAVLTRPNLIVLRSLTKFYALPGLRVGYAAAHPDRVSLLDQTRDPWSVSAVAGAAALAALADGDYYRRTRQWATTEPAFLFEALARLPGYRPLSPGATFILVEASEPAAAIQERLGPLGILIRDCRSFAGLTPHHMRLAVRSRAENLRLLDALHPTARP